MPPARRNPGTTKAGATFGSGTVLSVWQKATTVPGYDPTKWRKDRCGAWIEYVRHGDTSSEYGWEIDHEMPVARGGGDELANLQPLQWENNRHKSDSWPQWACHVTAS